MSLQACGDHWEHTDWLVDILCALKGVTVETAKQICTVIKLETRKELMDYAERYLPRTRDWLMRCYDRPSAGNLRAAMFDELLSTLESHNNRKLTTEEFAQRFGFAPENDDLDRVNCKDAGSLGHWSCGICSTHNKPRFICGCLAK